MKGDGLHEELQAQSCAVRHLSCEPLALPYKSDGMTPACSVVSLRFTFRIWHLRRKTHAFTWFFLLSGTGMGSGAE